jgi:glycosyltransferase involved in cell wall biosynthesis
MEAMSNGLPVVATNAGDVTRLLKDGKNGFTAHIGDYKGIAGKLHLLCLDYDMRTEYGKEAHKHIVNNYSFERFKKKYFEFISTLN